MSSAGTKVIFSTFSGVYCFDNPDNNSCDYFASVYVAPIISVVPSFNSVSVSGLPSVGFWSSVVSGFIVLGFLLF